MLYRPLIDLKTKALLYYMHDHMQIATDIPDVSMSVGHYFMPIWRSKPDNPILDLAVSSLAMVTFSRTQHQPSAAVEASLKYQELLRIAQNTTPSIQDQNIDACLLAAHFMSRYENASYSPGNLRLQKFHSARLNSFTHDDGSLAILKIWKEQATPDQAKSNVVKNVRRGVIRSFLLRSLAVPGWMMDGSSFGEAGLELGFDRIMVRLANLRMQLASLRNNDMQGPLKGPGLSKLLQEMLTEAAETDNALKQWKGDFPTSWQYQQQTLADPYPWPLRDFFSPTIFVYSKPAYAAVWNQYFKARMLVTSTRLRILDLVHAEPAESAQEEHVECIALLKEMANGLASSIPFTLGRIRVTSKSAPFQSGQVGVDVWEDIKPYMATLCIWPLSIASSLGNLDARYKSWFRSELARLGRIAGYGLMETAESDDWPEL